MFLDVVAPWIVEAWSEALAALVFDIPVVGLNPYQAHVAAAVVALLLLAMFWGSIAWLPVSARFPARCLMAAVLMAPAGVFLARHVEAMIAFARDPAAAEVRAQPAPGVAVSVAAPRSPVTQPLPRPMPLPQSAPPMTVTANSAPPPSVPVPVTSEPRAVIAKEPEAEPVAVPAPSTRATAAAAVRRVAASLTRMLPRAADADMMPVLFGTDRAIEARSGRLDFSAERAEKLSLGRALIQVPRRYQTADRDRPWAVSRLHHNASAPVGGVAASADDTHFAVYDIKALSHDEFLQAAVTRLAVSRRYKDHALVFVHGFNTTFETALYRAAQVAYDLRFDGAPFVYSWPSAGRVPRYSYDSDSARQAGPHLAGFLRVVIAATGAKSISVIAHGLGAGPVLDALVALKGEIPAGVALREIILVAPDVDRPAFEARIHELSGTARHITLYTAASDRGLNISRRFTGGVPRAGDVLEGGPLVLGGVDTVDASIPGTDAIGRNHAGYVEAGALVADIAARLGAETGAPTGLEPVASATGAYWRFPAEKSKSQR